MSVNLTVFIMVSSAKSDRKSMYFVKRWEVNMVRFKVYEVVLSNVTSIKDLNLIIAPL